MACFGVEYKPGVKTIWEKKKKLAAHLECRMQDKTLKPQSLLKEGKVA